MKVVIDIPKDFTRDYIADKFKDFFSRVIADIDNNGLCGNYEKEIAEMFIKAFDESIEAINTCNCQHNNNQIDNEPCCRCDSKHTNADRIRNMSDEELAEFLDIVGEDGISSQYADVPCDCCCEKTECSKCWKDWLQSEAE